MAIASPRATSKSRPGVRIDHHDGAEHRREIAEKVNAINQGKINVVSTVTLTANSATTILSDARIGPDSFIGFTPITSSAAAEIGTGGSSKFWAFSSPSATTGTFYWAGFYKHSGTSNDFSGGPSFGTANSSYAAHFFVVLGAVTVDELTLTVTGTSIDDTGTRTTTDTENIVIPNATPVDTYYETAKKWLGAVTITVASGTAKICDYGLSKYWDNSNTDFTVSGLEATWLGGANDTAPDIQLLHHKTTGWTYTGTGATPPTAIASMATDHGTEKQVVNNEDGAWKRTDLNTAIAGSGSEGVLFSVTTTANKAFEVGTLQISLPGASMYVSSRGNETATITHANNSKVDRTFVYAVLG